MTIETADTVLAELPRPDPGLIAQLFEQDPLSLTKTDLDAIVAELRADRRYYREQQEEAAKKPKKETKKAISEADQAAARDLLSDLGLD